MPILLNNNIVKGRELLPKEKFEKELFYPEDKLKVYTLDKYGYIKSSKGKRYFQIYEDVLIRITTSSGRYVDVSPDHPLLINDKGKLTWKRAIDINKDDEIFVLGKFNPTESLEIVKKTISFEKIVREFIAGKDGEWLIIKFKNGKKAKVKPFRIDEKFVKLLAFLNAEGHLTEKKFMLSQKEERKLLNEILSYLRSLGYDYVCYNGKDYIFKPAIISKYFYRILGKSKQLKSWFLYFPKELKRIYLKWFFSLDGTVNLKSRGIELVQKSESLINYLLLSLYEFGIFPKIHRKKVNGKIYWRLLIYGRDAETFIREIGFIGRKYKKAKILLRKIEKVKRKTYRSFDIDLRDLEGLIDILKDEKKVGGGIKRRKIYKAIEEVRKKGRITEELLERLIKIVEEKIQKLESIKEKDLKKVLPIRKIARINNIPKTAFSRKVEKNDKKAVDLLKIYLEEKIKKTKRIIKKLKQLYLESLRVEKVKSIEIVRPAENIIFDLHVPKTHTFFGGFGFILLHNTTLTEAITGKLTLSHSEELKRGITIRLGYADATIYKCKNCGKYSTSSKCPYCFSDTEPQRTVSFVDAPGHETLMATVLTGTALMDGAILVIAANEKCPQPQTREHLKALEVAGIKNVVVVQNKIDIVDEKRAVESYEEIKEFLKGTIIEDAPIIPISAQQRANIDVLIEAIEKYIPTPKRDPKKEPLMLVARSFDVNKPGIEPEKIVGGVLGGSIIQGKLKVGDEIEIRPGARIKGEYKTLFSKIKSLQKARKNLKEAGPGGLLGLMTKLDPFLTKADSLAGNVVGLVNELPEIYWKLEIEFYPLERLVGTEEERTVEPLKVGEALLINAWTMKSLGIVKRIGETVELELKIPVCIKRKERIVISRKIEGRWR
ncbi:MAG: translation initiation factor IF-2 subunit gamma, partial [Candidatus Aenigmarchaeota archaeon]|nr:translation initiation factor IF-2 subunit gamma [Candidatus Aenigmarchaeota archaeon]